MTYLFNLYQGKKNLLTFPERLSLMKKCLKQNSFMY